MEKEPDMALPIGEFFAAVKNGEWERQIAPLRAYVEKGDRKSYDDKKRRLPAVTLSCHCLSREGGLSEEAKAVTPSGWLQADFDLKDNPSLAAPEAVEAMRRALINDPHVAAVFVGPSGQGLKAVVSIAPQRHRESWDAAAIHFRDNHSLTLDKSTKDPMRLCFVSHDPALEISEDFTPLPLLETKAASKPGKASHDLQEGAETTAADIAEMLSYIPSRPDYETWLKIASAVWSVLPMGEGADLLDKWSPEEKPGEYATKHIHRLTQIGIGTLVMMAKEHGFDAKAAAKRKHWAGKITFAGPQEKTEEGSDKAKNQNHFDNDIGYSDSFIERYGKNLRFIAEEGQWLIFDNCRGWHRDISGEILSIITEYARELYNEALKAAAKCQDAKQGVAIVARASQLGAIKRIKAALQIAEANRAVVVHAEELDRDAYLLGTQNGVIDLRDGSFRTHSPGQLVTRTVSCRYDPEAKCPTFMQFLETVQPDPEMRQFIQRLCGYSLTGNMGEHILSFSYGVGANGKSTFLEHTVFQILGSYAAKLTDDLVYGDKHGNPPHLELAGLCGIRFALGEENADGGNLNEALLKSMTGGDRLKAKFHYKPFFHYSPTAKIHLVGNHYPRISGRDDGFWRRFRLVNWGVKIPESERDLRLQEKIKPEFSGILNWMIKGALDLGDNGTRPPASVLAATRKLREDSDPFGDFLREKTVNDSDGAIAKGELFSLYKMYCDDQETQQRFRLTQRIFHQRIAEKGYGEAIVENGTTRVWVGIRGKRSTDE